MTPDQPPQRYQQPSMFSTWIGMVLLFAFFGLLALVVVGASSRGNEYEKKRAKVRVEKLLATHEGNMKALTTYGWIDKSKGVVRIPVSEAMVLTINELANKAPAPANPIAAAEPSPAAQGAGPATVSPAPAPSASASSTPKPTSVSGPTSENRNQPAAANNPPPAPPGTQPGASTTPAPSSPAVKPSVAAPASPSPRPPGTPLPVRGKTP